MGGPFLAGSEHAEKDAKKIWCSAISARTKMSLFGIRKSTVPLLRLRHTTRAYDKHCSIFGPCHSTTDGSSLFYRAVRLTVDKPSLIQSTENPKFDTR
jgi:hypothetical protein